MSRISLARIENGHTFGVDSWARGSRDSAAWRAERGYYNLSLSLQNLNTGNFADVSSYLLKRYGASGMVLVIGLMSAFAVSGCAAAIDLGNATPPPIGDLGQSNSSDYGQTSATPTATLAVSPTPFVIPTVIPQVTAGSTPIDTRPINEIRIGNGTAHIIGSGPFVERISKLIQDNSGAVNCKSEFDDGMRLDVREQDHPFPLLTYEDGKFVGVVLGKTINGNGDQTGRDWQIIYLSPGAMLETMEKLADKGLNSPQIKAIRDSLDKPREREKLIQTVLDETDTHELGHVCAGANFPRTIEGKEGEILADNLYFKEILAGLISASDEVMKRKLANAKLDYLSVRGFRATAFFSSENIRIRIELNGLEEWTTSVYSKVKTAILNPWYKEHVYQLTASFGSYPRKDIEELIETDPEFTDRMMMFKEEGDFNGFHAYLTDLYTKMAEKQKIAFSPEDLSNNVWELLFMISASEGVSINITEQ